MQQTAIGCYTGGTMLLFKVGDRIRVVNLPKSAWLGSRGVIVRILERETPTGRIQECEVQFAAYCRWFLSTHLVNSVPEQMVKFFRSAVVERWNEVSMEHAQELTGDREQLIHLLTDQYNLTGRRAENEVEGFFAEFLKRIQLAA